MRRTSAALLIAGLLFTAACGGDDEGDGDGGNAETADATDPGAEGGEGTGGEGAEGGEGGEGGGSGEFCDAYDSLSTSQDPEAMAAEFASLEPPAEIADAWQTMMDAGGDTSSPEAMEAAQEVGAYVMQECMNGELPEMPEGSLPTEGN
jgi:hypothetical protein